MTQDEASDENLISIILTGLSHRSAETKLSYAAQEALGDPWQGMFKEKA